MRHMSFAMTTRQVRDGEKSVTRRLRWVDLRVGTFLCAIVKGQGLKKGERVERLRVIEVVSVRRELLSAIVQDLAYGREECIREGFPDLTPAAFVDMFCLHNNCSPNALVTRIEFAYVV